MRGCWGKCHRRLSAGLVSSRVLASSRVLVSSPVLLVLGCADAGAQTSPGGEAPLQGWHAVWPLLIGVGRGDFFGLVFFFGLSIFATTTAILHVRSSSRWTRRDHRTRAEIETLRGRAERAEGLLMSEPQIVAVWTDPEAPPAMVGELPGLLAYGTREAFPLASQLESSDEAAVTAQLAALRGRGEGFRRVVRAKAGAFLEIQGSAIKGWAVLRIRNVTGERLELARVGADQSRLAEQVAALTALLDAAPLPVWMRDAGDRLTFVNRAYAEAVETASPDEALTRGTELLDRQAREEARQTRLAGRTFVSRVPAVVGHARRMLDVVDIPLSGGSTFASAGLGIDVSELEAARGDLGRQMQAQARTLDRLATAVAVFNADRRLTFYNTAYRALWDFDPAFLDGQPPEGEILDRLRALNRLPEQADYRAWRQKLFDAYRSLDDTEQWWHLPGGQTLRVFTTPNPTGGVTYLYEDVTERIDLEARFNALARVQGETLDALREGVAAFGPDGRLRLYNPPFAAFWKLSPQVLEGRPHIEELVRLCGPLVRDGAGWQGLKASVTGLGQERAMVSDRLQRVDGSVIELLTVALPDGGTLATFADVTDSVNFENALVDKNQALEEASRIKNDFVQRVSYELRSPLTNIIGFVQLLADGAAGPLSARQLQYAGYIMTSSDALLAIINNILDLATIDAGVMTLEMEDVDIRSAMEAAAEGVQHRLVETGVRLEMRASPSIGSFPADGKRVRQILFNLLSNAVGFSENGGVVQLSADRTSSEVLFRVVDSGRGIPRAVLDQVFDRFESHTLGSEHRGVGLGLSIVRSFVTLHGGTVEIVSAEGEGTNVLCRFPVLGTPLSEAAE